MLRTGAPRPGAFSQVQGSSDGQVPGYSGSSWAFPTPAPSSKGVRSGAEVVIQQWEGPRPLGRVRTWGGGGEGSWRQHPGKDKISRGAGGAVGPPKQDVASSFRTRPFGAPGLWGGGGAGRGGGAPRAPSSRGGAQLLGAEGPHPGLKSPPGPGGREGGRTRGRPLLLLLPGVVRGALT